MVCFNYEIKDKSEFLLKKKNDMLQADLHVILKEFPEAVIIQSNFNRHKKKILMTNREACKLLVQDFEN